MPLAPPPSCLPAEISLGVGGAGLVVGTVFGILAIGNKSSLKGECQGTACPASAQGDIKSFGRNGTISTTSFVGGGVGVAVAVVLYLLERPSRERATQPRGSRRVRAGSAVGSESEGKALRERALRRDG